jgi:hypothetical protein
VAALEAALEAAGIGEGEGAEWREIYEAVFRHRAFAGRSSTMYKYEGLGCIYWHMVSKLLLAVAEFLDDAREQGAAAADLQRLSGHFHDIKAGLGPYKSPAEYGAIPLDPYSHTPGFSGAQQPGMTGQVKEDILSRLRELGVVTKAGIVSFAPYLLKRDEFPGQSTSCEFVSGSGDRRVDLDAGSLAFSLCGTPVIYRTAQDSAVHVFAEDGEHAVLDGTSLGAAWSGSLFNRDKQISTIVVDLPEGILG